MGRVIIDNSGNALSVFMDGRTVYFRKMGLFDPGGEEALTVRQLIEKYYDKRVPERYEPLLDTFAQGRPEPDENGDVPEALVWDEINADLATIRENNPEWLHTNAESSSQGLVVSVGELPKKQAITPILRNGKLLIVGESGVLFTSVDGGVSWDKRTENPEDMVTEDGRRPYVISNA